MMGYILITGVIFFVLLYFYFTRHFNHWKDKNVPFVKPLPFFGNIFDGILMRHSMGEIFTQLYNKKKDPILGFFVLDKPCLLVKDPQIIKKILVNDFQYFCDRSVMSNKRDDPVGAHILFVLKNPDWKELRSKITPVYTSSKIRVMSELMEEATHKMVNYLNLRTGNGAVIEMKEVCIKYTVDVISSTAFGINANTFEENSEFCVAAKRLTDWDNLLTGFRMRCYFLAHSLVKIFRMALLDPQSVSFLKRNFLEIMNSRAVSNVARNDLIDILLQLKKSDKYFKNNEILLAQAVVFFTAGFETSSSTMCFTLYELSHHLEIQNKLRKEIIDVHNRHGSMNYDAIKEMAYLDMCVKETLRKYPVLPFLERNCCTRYTIRETGTIIDKNTPVFIPVLALHYDSNYFPDPETFDPERFSKDNKQKTDAFAYLPFGEGPRNCIGARFGMMTVKLGLANILKNFVVNSTGPKEKLKFNPNGILLAPLHGMKLKLEKI